MAIILAVGVSIALICFVIGIEVNATYRVIPLSENATQVLTAAFSGIIGGLAGYLGGRGAGNNRQ